MLNRENENRFHAHNSTDPQFYINSDAAAIHINDQAVSSCIPFNKTLLSVIIKIDAYPGQVVGINVTINDAFNRTIGATVRFADANPNYVKIVLFYALNYSLFLQSSERIKFEPAALVYHQENSLLMTQLVISQNHSVFDDNHTFTATTFFSIVRLQNCIFILFYVSNIGANTK